LTFLKRESGVSERWKPGNTREDTSSASQAFFAAASDFLRNQQAQRLRLISIINLNHEPN